MNKSNFWVILLTGIFGVAGVAITGRIESPLATLLFLLICVSIIVILSLIFKEK